MTTPVVGYRPSATAGWARTDPVSRNKRSIALDFGTDDNAVARHSRRADVFIRNFKPGGLSRFGLDYHSVRDNPGIVYCSISGFGSGGSLAPGYDLLVQGISGLMSLTGAPDGPPYRAGVAVFDVMAGMHSAIGILAALHHRDQTAQGQEIEINLLSSALSALVNQTSAYVAGGVVPKRMGNAHLSLYPYEPMPTGDGELIIAAGNDRQFRKLADALGAGELADDELFSTVLARKTIAISCGRCWRRCWRRGRRRSGSGCSATSASRVRRSTMSAAVCNLPRNSGWNQWSRPVA